MYSTHIFLSFLLSKQTRIILSSSTLLAVKKPLLLSSYCMFFFKTLWNAKSGKKNSIFIYLPFTTTHVAHNGPWADGAAHAKKKESFFNTVLILSHLLPPPRTKTTFARPFSGFSVFPTCDSHNSQPPRPSNPSPGSYLSPPDQKVAILIDLRDTPCWKSGCLSAIAFVERCCFRFFFFR